MTYDKKNELSKKEQQISHFFLSQKINLAILSKYQAIRNQSLSKRLVI